MKTTNIIIIALILLSFVIGIYLYPQMPEQMASHWNARGEVDDYMSKFWGLFIFPIVLIGLFIMFLFIPKIDPLKENIAKFRKYFDLFILFMTLFLFYIYILSLVWNLGREFNMTLAIVPVFGLLFFYIGIMVENAKRNWFIGIRTPWTLSSDRVWEKTHKIGGKLFKITGIITLIGLFFQRYSIWFLLIPVFFTVIYTLAYSYFEYQKEVKK